MTGAAPPANMGRALLLAAVAAPWALGAEGLRTMWAFGVERYFGFAVFPLAGYLFFLRWENFGEPAAVSRASRAAWGALAVAGAAGIGLALLLLLPNPLWTAPAWVAAAGAIMVSTGLLAAAGGPRWARRALGPLAFALMALPWPARVEVPLVGKLREWNAVGAAEIVSAAGRPAIARGSVIETAGGFVGVDEACSGIVALQTALMLAIFLGELRGLRAGARLRLAVGAGAIALAVNLARTTWLTWRGAADGVGAVRALHEAAGFSELGVAVVAVVIFGFWIGGEQAEEKRGAPARGNFPRAWPVATLGALALGGLGAEFWYRTSEAGTGAAEIKWRLTAPDAGWRAMPVTPGVRAENGHDAVVNLTWHDPATGRDWIALHIQWDADPALRYEAGLHGPEICLPAAGARLDGAPVARTLTLAGVAVTMNAVRFTAGGETFHTFSCLWDAARGAATDTVAEAALDLAKARIALVRERRRPAGLERITLVLNRCRDDEEALALARAMAPKLFRRR